jgi:hypothetical protein
MKDLQERLSNTVQSCLDGDFSSLEAYCEMKQLEKHLKTCLDKIQEEALQEAGQEEKEFSKFGYNIMYRNGSGKWSFKGIKKWEFMKAEQKAELKKLQDDLINKAQNTDGFSEETGEVFEELPVKKYDKDSLIIKVK